MNAQNLFSGGNIGICCANTNLRWLLKCEMLHVYKQEEYKWFLLMNEVPYYHYWYMRTQILHFTIISHTFQDQTSFPIKYNLFWFCISSQNVITSLWIQSVKTLYIYIALSKTTKKLHDYDLVFLRTCTLLQKTHSFHHAGRGRYLCLVLFLKMIARQ